MIRSLVASAIIISLVVVGCGTQADRSVGEGTVDDLGTRQAALHAQTFEVGEVSGSLTTPEDLCVVIDAEAAREALGYEGRLVSEVFEDPDNVEAIRGVCRYLATDAAKVEGAMAEVTAPGRGPDLQKYREALQKAGRTYQDLTVVGADDALWIDHHHTALVRYGDSVGLAQNLGTVSMEPSGLVVLAAMAAKAGRN